jgi:hypothetical protein
MPLIYRDRGESKSGTIWNVMSGSLPIARIWKEMSSNERYQTWSWTFSVSGGFPDSRQRRQPGRS